MSLTIDIAVEDEAWTGVDGLPGAGELLALVDRAIAAAIGKSGLPVPADAELSIVLCDDEFIRKLNQTWRGKDKPTNVLSFPTADVEDGPESMLGDIVIAFETCQREAAADGITMADHLCHLVVHGFFHLLGYDHDDDTEADAMEAMEARALGVLGIASPYEDAEDRRDPP